MKLQPLKDEMKSGKWFLRDLEDHARPYLARCVPSFIETYHLTLMTVLWSFGVVISGYYAQFDIRFLWLSSLMIVCQYMTDMLDGTIGRLRNTGLIKWGYFMDHFLDYIFFTALILSYAYILPEKSLVLLIIVTLIQIGFMINIFLSFATTEKLHISFAGIGPSEIRILYIIFNIYLIFFGIDLPVMLMYYFAIMMSIALMLNVYFTQKKIWKLDIDIKNNTTVKSE